MQAVLFEDIGWKDLLDKPEYKDTCAIRMSVGLLRSGVSLPGARMRANAGTIKGHYIEPGQGKLSMMLKRLWGEPEVYKGAKPARAATDRSAVALMFDDTAVEANLVPGTLAKLEAGCTALARK